MSDQDILARTIYGEARGEGISGMNAVANVIMNRVALSSKHPHFGHGTVESACLAPWQFSCWNQNDPNREKLLAVTNDDHTFSLCQGIAEVACAGKLPDATDGATYYYVKNSPEPAWAVGKMPCAVIGHHLFYKDIA